VQFLRLLEEKEKRFLMMEEKDNMFQRIIQEKEKTIRNIIKEKDDIILRKSVEISVLKKSEDRVLELWLNEDLPSELKNGKTFEEWLSEDSDKSGQM